MQVSFQYTYVNKHFSHDIKEYFLFNGFNIVNNSSFKNNNLKQVIFKYSHLELLQKIIQHLNNVKNLYIRDLSVLEKGIKKSFNTTHLDRDKIDSLSKEMNDVEKTIESIDDEIRNIEEYFENFDFDENNLYCKKLIYLDKNIKKCDKELLKLSKRYHEFILTKYPYVLSYDYFNKFLELSDEELDVDNIGDVSNHIKDIVKDILILNLTLIWLILLII